MWRSLLCSMCVASLAAVDVVVDSPRTRAEAEAELRALDAVEDIQTRITAIRSMPTIDERMRAAARLGDNLERLLDRCRGTRQENRALFYLANWRLEFDDGQGVTTLLDQLQRLGFPGYKAAGRGLRARLHLKRGAVPEARLIAEGLVQELPEFAWLLELVAFHEQVGHRAPSLTGRNLTGGPSDPARERNEPWLLVIFAGLGEPTQRWLAQEYLKELSDEAYAGRIRPVVVSFDGNPLEALTTLQAMELEREVDLLWANPNPDGDAPTWRSNWGLSVLPTTVLLGPDRHIMAAEPSQNQLRRLVGRSDAPTRADSGPGRGVTWRGRR